MAQDINLRTAGIVHDISVNTAETSTVLNLAKDGLSKGLYVTVQCTEVTAQAVGVVTFVAEISTDAGTTWRDAGSRKVPQTFVATPAGQLCGFPLGFRDVQPEKKTDIRVRFQSRIAATIANADDFTIVWSLGDDQGYVGPLD